MYIASKVFSYLLTKLKLLKQTFFNKQPRSCSSSNICLSQVLHIKINLKLENKNEKRVPYKHLR